MATRQVQVVTPSSQAYAAAERKRAVADALQKRSMTPRDMSQMQGADPYLSGLTQLGEALLARYAGKQATGAEAGAESAARAGVQTGINELIPLGQTPVEGQIDPIDNEAPIPLAPGASQNMRLTLPDVMAKRQGMTEATNNMPAQQAQSVISQALLEKYKPVQLDPDKVAQRRMVEEQTSAALEEKRAAREQRIQELNYRIEEDRRRGKESDDLRRELGRLQADTARSAQENTAAIAASNNEARMRELKAKIEADNDKRPAVTSQASANEILASIGYKEGQDDEVTALLKKSTGSGVGKAVDRVASWGGVTTNGAEAGDTLGSRSAEIVRNLLGGKLGAGISNADRDFLEKLPGQLSDTSIPRERRIAAWHDFLGRQKRMAGASPVTAPAPAAQKTIVRRGTLNGRAVVQYSDGTTDYAD